MEAKRLTPTVARETAVSPLLVRRTTTLFLPPGRKAAGTVVNEAVRSAA